MYEWVSYPLLGLGRGNCAKRSHWWLLQLCLQFKPRVQLEFRSQWFVPCLCWDWYTSCHQNICKPSLILQCFSIRLNLHHSKIFHIFVLFFRFCFFGGGRGSGSYDKAFSIGWVGCLVHYREYLLREWYCWGHYFKGVLSYSINWCSS